MTSLYIARHSLSRARTCQAALEGAHGIRVLGAADSVWRAQAALTALDADALLIDLQLEDGAALSLVRSLRERRAERPRVMLVAPDASDPLLFSTLRAGADAYLLEADLPVAASLLRRMQAGEASMAAPVAVQLLRFFNQSTSAPKNADAATDRSLDWRSHAANPLQLSPGEVRLVQRVAAGLRTADLAARMGLSLEAVGRRIANLYRKLSWDVRSGALSLLAA